MAPEQPTNASEIVSSSGQVLDLSQTLRASSALLRKIQSDRELSRSEATAKTDLLAGADEKEDDGALVWLVLTTKKHIIDKKRLKPGKVLLPHPLHDISSSNLRICLITADPQRTYKDLIADPSFPLEFSQRIGRVIGLSKLKAKYKSFESRRQLYGEHDVFLADDRIITSLPQLLGKVFYKTGSRRPIPVTLEGRRQSVDQQGNKRRKLSEGGSKVVKANAQPADVAKEIQRTLSCALVHLAPSTTTAVKVGISSMEPQQLQENVTAVTQALVEKHVPQKWRNVRSIHIKGPETAALPIWLADELWEDEADVLEAPLPERHAKKTGKRKRGALETAFGVDTQDSGAIEVPGADGKMRRLEKPVAKSTSSNGMVVVQKSAKKSRIQDPKDEEGRAADLAEKAARHAALQRQKAAVKGTKNGAEKKVESNGAVKSGKKTRVKAADLI